MSGSFFYADVAGRCLGEEFSSFVEVFVNSFNHFRLFLTSHCICLIYCDVISIIRDITIQERQV